MGITPSTTRRSTAPHRSGAPASATALLARARVMLHAAEQSDDIAEQFCLAHVAALRTAAVVLADRGRSAQTRRRLTSVWVLLERDAPEYATWAAHFASAASIRSAVEAGAFSAVSPVIAAEQLQMAREFLATVESSLGLLAA